MTRTIVSNPSGLEGIRTRTMGEIMSNRSSTLNDTKSFRT